ncbi:iron import ATP-binding/permease protein IrtA [Mycobacteroides abscessus subsp. massiliense]|uniref:ABC transporter ATP-binding protein n=1 Tax=Mycobacteroides abscessus TaxID=36809 RepID=UPI0009A598ED|nr:ABC transporter ATP-binding protein [Mycobacteroides abscessus]SKF86533.1 iron import ATP-binding/permease protein IrtA [Mycobacteroides abscessus subsp. massiliense]SKG52316.1 iron import ATP-binding/permease protein IrtA [Mycobacteroides abscessus subsp. massiliense]SKI92278.1 iron import ATP-binding/permease protein IrtA [Mycobacteroides abscessus subsp. massiliense]SKJ56134.1 iron import ATP-binding/permease protein IrtA [Mycobacteroides abscessus subsp. massiliense]SKL19229.1 iron impo
MRAVAADAESGRPVQLFGAVRGRIILIALLGLVSAVCSIVPFIVIVELSRLLWTMQSAHVDRALVWIWVLAAGGALMLSFAAASTSSIVSHFVDNDLQLDLRKRIIDRFRKLPLGWFGRRTSSDVRKLAEHDVTAVHQLVGHAIADVLTVTIVPALSLAYLFATEWHMALASLLPAVVTLLLYALAMSRVQEQYAQYDRGVTDLGAATIEFVHGIVVVKSFGQLGQSHQRYRKATENFARLYQETAGRSSLLVGLIMIVSSPGVVLTYLAGVSVWLTRAGTLQPTDVLPSFLLALGLTAPLLRLGASSHKLRSALRARNSLMSFFAQPAMPVTSSPEIPQEHDIACDGVSFTYDDERIALDRVFAQLPSGTVTALVGPSGSGKSTLARLVPRFYDVAAGSVKIGGSDVRNITPEQLYRATSFVFQEAHMLRTTVRDNIRLTRPSADESSVKRAAQAAQIHERIMRLPRGYDSVIGQDAHLSGGEAQRLTIARALLTDAPILVLDEATSFADPDSEASVQQALSALAAERTLLVIAHRLHTIIGADQILVLNNGRVVERGTHTELDAAGGVYHEMWHRYQRARNIAVSHPNLASGADN